MDQKHKDKIATAMRKKWKNKTFRQKVIKSITGLKKDRQPKEEIKSEEKQVESRPSEEEYAAYKDQATEEYIRRCLNEEN